MLDDVLFVDEHQAVQTKLLLAGGSLVVAVALVADLVARFAHVAVAHLDEGDRGVLVERYDLFNGLFRHDFLGGFRGLDFLGGLVHFYGI